MSVISKVFDNIGIEILKSILNGNKYEGNIKIGDYEGKIIIKSDIVKSRDEKSQNGIDIFIAFDFAIFRVNINIS